MINSFERYARIAWTPFFLSTLLVITWVAVELNGDIFYQNEAEKLFLRLMIVIGLQIFSGNSGVLSFGQVGFMAVGAYMSALLTIPLEIKKFTFLSMPGFMKSWVFPAHLNEWNGTTGTLAGAGFAILFAAVFGIPIVRLIGVAAGIGTIAILVAMNVFIQQTSSITRGTSTQIGVPQTTTLGSTVVWLVIAIVIAYAFRQSRLGLRLRASRENERAAKSVGVNIAKERYLAFVLSGFICGLGGALYAHYFISFSYLDFYFDLTFITIAMLVVGGMGSVSGGVIGAYFLTFIYVAFQRLEVNGLFDGKAPSGTADLVLALALLLTLIYRPKGITGGKEIPFPTDWSFRWVGRLLRGEIRPKAHSLSEGLKVLGLDKLSSKDKGQR